MVRRVSIRPASAVARFLSLFIVFSATAVLAQSTPGWPQWGQNPQHTGNPPVVGQAPLLKLADTTFDPFVSQETAESRGSLLMHYQAPLVGGNIVFMGLKSGTYTSCNPPGSGTPFPCGPDAWNNEIWNEVAWQMQNGQLVQLWSFASDWVPVPNSGSTPSTKSLGGWEPLFQPALSGSYIYVSGGAGTIYKLNQSTGTVISHINPFGTRSGVFVSSPLTADAAGNIYYHAIQFDVAWPWDENISNAWLVKIAPDDSVTTVTFKALLPGAPTSCLWTFLPTQLPWPPSPNAVPGSIVCGSQRPPLNLAPTISADGSTVYTASRAHFSGRTAYLLAINTADLSLQWSTSLEELLDDGCNVLLPPNGQAGGCRTGSNTGVDPTQNTLGGAILSDQASASPAVAPDGSILFGVNTAYNYGRGHLLKFSAQGVFEGNYDFGWDSTPAIFGNAGSYSVILKDNHYDNGSYCNNQTWCPKAPPGPYYMTELDSNLVPQWKFADPTVNKNHPNGYEWCVNAPAVDAGGVVYGSNEDGNLYVIQPNGSSVQKLFLEQSLDAGYTPVSLGTDGTIYAENGGHLLVVGGLFSTATSIISSSQNPSTWGTPVTFTAQVTSGGTTPTGTVTFNRGSTKLGTGTLSNSVASFTTKSTQLPAGMQSITAVYSGDSKHSGSTSSAFAQTVNKAPTTTVASSQPNPSAIGQNVTLTATVTASVGVPIGNVQFTYGKTLLGTVAINNGVATLNYAFQKDGTYTVKASYAGNPTYLSSSGTFMQKVQH